jgi:2-polyprenyl-3-methyl-5-hydroxy-6-metoxy-1,4-benzoquinol methylase
VCQTASPWWLEKDQHQFYQCPKCQLAFVWPEPTQAFLSEEVYSKKAGYQGNKAKNLALVPLAPKQQKVLDYLLTQKPQGRLLDVGCSNGHFLFWAKQAGLEVVGVELNPATAEIAQKNGLSVSVGTIESATFEPSSFDFILMGDLIEHVTNPRAVIQAASKLLRPGGLLVLVTPNLDCFWSKMVLNLKRCFSAPPSVLTPPHHLVQFSTENLKQLTRQLGFETQAVWFNLPGSLKYELGMTHLLGRYKRSRNISDLLYLVFIFGLYSLIFAINWLSRPFRQSDFGLVLVTKK